MMRSNYVIAGGQHVANWASGWAKNVTVIPTCVDLQKYPVSAQRVSSVHKPIIGWIGTPITSRYLKAIAPSLRMLRQRHDFTLKVIGDPIFALDGLDVQALPWTEASEVCELRSCDIGIMPIPDDSWARGKSALKLIQYMAAGIPAVASPVGANCQVVRHGYDGLLAATGHDWVANLSMLIEQPERRREIGAEGRRTVDARYSLQVNVPHVADMLRQAAR